MTTALTIIKAALRKIGKLGTGQSLPAEEAADALEALNGLIELWAVDDNKVYTQTRESFPLVGGKAAYTIGSGADFNTARPVEIIAAFTRMAGGVDDQPLTLWDIRQYATLNDRITTGRPEILYYDGNFPIGSITLWPVPNQADTLHLYSYKELSAFPLLSTDINLPPGYEQALVFNLAVMMAPEYETEASPTVKKLAGQYKRVIENANTKTFNDQLTIDPTLLEQSRFNIYTGRYQ